MDLITIIGMVYGVILILATFINNKVLLAFRIDSLFMANPTPQTRFLNLFFGIIILGYMIYSIVV